MELWTAFLLGLVGSLHCAGMCGPIALSLPSHGSFSKFIANRLAYNVGRVATYCLLGVVFGTIGKSFALLGWQRWISLIAGVVILLALALSSRISFGARIVKPVATVKVFLGKLLHDSSLTSTFCIGALNGFLPCGLVYAACAGATAMGGIISGMAYMAVFGLGTIPMMLGIALGGKRLPFAFRLKLQRIIPITLIFLGMLLIFRGLALGIPYLSPDLAHGVCCNHGNR